MTTAQIRQLAAATVAALLQQNPQLDMRKIALEALREAPRRIGGVGMLVYYDAVTKAIAVGLGQGEEDATKVHARLGGLPAGYVFANGGIRFDPYAIEIGDGGAVCGTGADITL